MFTWQPLPAGPRVAVVTWTGAQGVIAMDQLEQAGLQAAPLADSTVREIQSLFPDWFHVANPVDIWIALEREPDRRTEAILDCLLGPHSRRGSLPLCWPSKEGRSATCAGSSARSAALPSQTPRADHLGARQGSLAGRLAGASASRCSTAPGRAVRALAASARYRAQTTQDFFAQSPVSEPYLPRSAGTRRRRPALGPEWAGHLPC